ncbi:MAG: hypothetical protein RL033_6624 [Pseudomonadota bacterium]
MVAERSLFPVGLLLCLLGSTACQKEAAAARAEPRSEVPATSCGSSGLPDCPLQLWMKATMQAHLRRHDYERLGAALEELAKKEPPGYAGWAESSAQGAAAAARKDEAGVSQSCKTCHSQHRDRYRKELRGQAMF